MDKRLEFIRLRNKNLKDTNEKFYNNMNELDKLILLKEEGDFIELFLKNNKEVSIKDIESINYEIHIKTGFDSPYLMFQVNRVEVEFYMLFRYYTKNTNAFAMKIHNEIIIQIEDYRHYPRHSNLKFITDPKEEWLSTNEAKECMKKLFEKLVTKYSELIDTYRITKEKVY